MLSYRYWNGINMTVRLSIANGFCDDKHKVVTRQTYLCVECFNTWK